MSDEPYVPFHVRETKTEDAYRTLVQGVPEWIQGALWELCEEQLWDYDRMTTRRSGVRVEAIRYLEQLLRKAIPVGNVFSGNVFQGLIEILEEDHDLFLSVVEALANFSGNYNRSRYVQSLAETLSRGSSAYEVTRLGSNFHLEHRVPPAIKTAFTETVSTSGKAGRYLEEAWHYVYRHKPDPGAGYRQAVKAVEAVACPLVLPKDKVPTLGKVIARMQDAPTKFEVTLQPSDGEGIAKVRALCELLWRSQLDRHGDDDPEKPLNVSQKEAEMAVQAAVTLVAWLSGGHVTLKA